MSISYLSYLFNNKTLIFYQKIFNFKLGYHYMIYIDLKYYLYHILFSLYHVINFGYRHNFRLEFFRNKRNNK